MTLLTELFTRHRALVVFALIGGINTVLHSGTVIALVEANLAPVVAAHVIGFALANTFSFFANCALAFQQPPSWTRYKRFLMVSMLSLGLTVGLSALAQYLAWHYLAGLLLVLLCGPVLTFVLHKAITFR